MRLKMNLNDFSKRLQHNIVKKLKGSEYFLNPLYLFYKLTRTVQTHQGNVLKGAHGGILHQYYVHGFPVITGL